MVTQYLVQEVIGRSLKVYVGNSIAEIEALFNVKVVAVLSDVYN